MVKISVWFRNIFLWTASNILVVLGTGMFEIQYDTVLSIFLMKCNGM